MMNLRILISALGENNSTIKLNRGNMSDPMIIGNIHARIRLGRQTDRPLSKTMMDGWLYKTNACRHNISVTKYSIIVPQVQTNRERMFVVYVRLV